jgi:hypothetical protein
MDGKQVITTVTPVEILSVSPAVVNGKTHLVITHRPNKDSFEVSSIAITASQAVRLWRDLCFSYANSPLMEQAIKENPDNYGIFKQIMLDQSVNE